MDRILVVDDSAMMVMNLQSVLSIGGFEVHTARDGNQALALLDAGLRPDLILTDIIMPNMDGIVLTKLVKARLPDTPILILTTDGQRYRRERAAEYGASGWLVKPVTGSDLLRVVRHVIDTARETGETIGPSGFAELGQAEVAP